MRSKCWVVTIWGSKCGVEVETGRGSKRACGFAVVGMGKRVCEGRGL